LFFVVASWLTFGYNKLYHLCMTKSEAIEIFGSSKKVADALGITKGAVSNWPKESIPRARELEIKHILRPELFEQEQSA